ncbi:DUF4276 family protein [Candidatus Sumerlaeota bacterium]|nr:DUF4276 family protein [Candidatus Sumerlaeota bacterium]
MHFEILVEDASGKIALDILLKKILGTNGKNHSWRIFGYKGIGRIPDDLRKNRADPSKRMLLNNLPRLMKGYGNTYKKDPNTTIIVVVDLDDRDCKVFKRELLNIQNQCIPSLNVLFRIAIEELESWFLGDPQAVKSAYPKVDSRQISSYKQDSICGTWEKLADAVHPGGSSALNRLGGPSIGQIKCEWAEKITPYIDVQKNKSRSFQVFLKGIQRLASVMN